MSYIPIFDSGFHVMNSELSTSGKCGPENKGICNRNRYCNVMGECGPEQTHRDDSQNNSYRFCNKYNDTNCMSFVDKQTNGKLMVHTTKDNYYVYGLKRMTCPSSFK